jgi:hypothetical protein
MHTLVLAARAGYCNGNLNTSMGTVGASRGTPGAEQVVRTDRRTLRWNSAACAHARIALSKLPPLADYDEAVLHPNSFSFAAPRVGPRRGVSWARAGLAAQPSAARRCPRAHTHARTHTTRTPTPRCTSTARVEACVARPTRARMRTHTCIHVPEVLWAWEWAGGWAEQVRGLSPEFASRWPELRSVPFFLAVGDGAAGNASPWPYPLPRTPCTLFTPQ